MRSQGVRRSTFDVTRRSIVQVFAIGIQEEARSRDLQPGRNRLCVFQHPANGNGTLGP